MSAAVRQAVEMEELNGAIQSNRFRYVFVALVALPVLWTGLEAGPAGVINFVGFVAYLAVTIVHSRVLRATTRVRRLYDYIALVCDFLVLTLVTLTWTRVYSPDNFAFALKNTAMIYMLIPLALSVFQFRLALTCAAAGLYLLVSGSFLAYGLYSGVPLTDNWRDYLLGPAIVLPDMFARPVVALCLALALGYAIYRALFMVRRIAMVENQKAALSRYFAPQVVEEITKEEDAEAVRGRRQPVTVLFSDVRDFTALSESLGPDDIVALLGELRQRQTRVIFDFAGTLDKFIGDAVMATFGTPRPSAEPGRDCTNAVLAGRAMLRSIRDWNRERLSAGLPEIRIGVGLHCGEVFVGNVGFEGRLEYTVIGDTVNTAARIEALCKTFDWPFVISRDVQGALLEGVPTEPLPDVRVKGKAEPLAVCRVLWEI